MKQNETRPLGRKTPSRRPLRIGVVGGGRMGQHHIRAIQRLTHWGTLVGIADPAEAVREQLPTIAPQARTFPSLDAMLAAESIDVLHICTAPHTHERLAREGIEAGSSVYIEKPFVATAGEAARLIALAASRGVRICAGHQLLYEAPARDALAVLPAIGAVVHLQSYFAFRPVRRTPDGRVPLSVDLQLLDVLPHPVYLLLGFLEAIAPGGRAELAALEIGPGGTVHALVRRGGITGSLVVTLEGRPVDSYVRAVGTNGSVTADFVRGTVQRLIGPGTSGIDKAAVPFRLGRQLLTGTTTALARRILKRQRSYPGLTEIFEAFYSEVATGGPCTMSADSIVETVRLCEAIATGLARETDRVAAPVTTPRFLVTGGTGFLGREVARALVTAGDGVRVVSRRLPPSWDRSAGVAHVAADLSDQVPSEILAGVDTIVHCAAETAGGWDEHQRNSLDVTERLLRAAAAAGIRRFVHISSLAVQAEPGHGHRLTDDGPLDPEPRARGPYVWGKLESEQLAVRLGSDLGVAVHIVRPGALMDRRRFEPPGRLGKRLGNVFVAVGSPRDELGVVDVDFAGRVIAWTARHFDQAPERLNLLAPVLPTRGSLVRLLRQSNPDLTVVWLPRLMLRPLAMVGLAVQAVLRPGRPAIDVAKVFASGCYDTTRIAGLARTMEESPPSSSEARMAWSPDAEAIAAS